MTGIRACSTTAPVAQPGTVTIRCRLTNAARRARAGGALRITLVTTFTPTGGTPARSTTTVTVARTAAATASHGAAPPAVTG